MPSDMVFRTAFGSWGKALKKAGFKPTKFIPIGARKGKRNKKRKKVLSNGYYHIYEPSHPMAMKNGYVREHRMIAYDLGMLIDLSDEVHHENEIKTDNWPGNFQILSKNKHTSITWKGKKRKGTWTKERRENKSKQMEGNKNWQGNPELLNQK